MEQEGKNGQGREISFFLNCLEDHFFQGATLQDKLGITEADMEVMEAAASHLLQEKQFSEAVDAFVLLATLNPNVSHLWLNLGMAEQGTKNYREALEALGLAVATDPGDPSSHIRAAECYIALKDYTGAVHALGLAIDCMGSEGPDKLFKAQTIKLRNALISKYLKRHEVPHET